MTIQTLSDSELIKRLTNKLSQTRSRMIEAQARNYELRYAGLEQPKEIEMKARIEWLESEVRRLSAERDRK